MTTTGHWSEIDRRDITAELRQMFDAARKRGALSEQALLHELANEIGFNEQVLQGWMIDPPDYSEMNRVPKAMHAALFKRLGK